MSVYVCMCMYIYIYYSLSLSHMCVCLYCLSLFLLFSLSVLFSHSLYSFLTLCTLFSLFLFFVLIYISIYALRWYDGVILRFGLRCLSLYLNKFIQFKFLLSYCFVVIDNLEIIKVGVEYDEGNKNEPNNLLKFFP